MNYPKLFVLYNNKGMAMLLTLITLSLLTVVTIQFHRTTWSNLHQAHTSQKQIKLHTAGKSGINIGLYYLSLKDKEQPNVDSAFSLWHEKSNENLPQLYDDMSLTVTLNDAEAKIPINYLANQTGAPKEQQKATVYRETLHRILISDTFGLEEEDSRELVAAITDWLDKNDTVMDDGAESDYYEDLTPAYKARDASITTLNDLLPVRGMTYELLFGSDETGKGLSDYITPIGSSGLININTASKEVLRYIFPQLTDSLLENIVEFRENEDNRRKLNNVEWYKSIPGWPKDIVLAKELLTVRSTAFTIVSEVEAEASTLTFTATANRPATGKVELLNRRIQY